MRPPRGGVRDSPFSASRRSTKSAIFLTLRRVTSRLPCPYPSRPLVLRGARKAKREGDPAIVLFHGLLFDGGMWRAQVEPLSALGRVVIIDGPGHGKSEAPPRFTLEDHADALATGSTSSGSQRRSSAGSRGGGCAMCARPERVAAMALLDTSAEGRRSANGSSTGRSASWRVTSAYRRRSSGRRLLRSCSRRTRSRAPPPSSTSSRGRSAAISRVGITRAATAVSIRPPFDPGVAAPHPAPDAHRLRRGRHGDPPR